MNSAKSLLPVLLIASAVTLASCSRPKSTSETGENTQQNPGNAAPGQAAAPSGAPLPAPAGSPQAGANSATSAAPSAAPAAPQQASFELPSGTHIAVRLDQKLSTETNQPGDGFTATLDRPVVVQGQQILPHGTKFTGKVTQADASGRLQGRAVLGISLDSVELNGQTYPIKTSTETETSASHQNRNLGIIGGTTGFGALLGAIAGRGKGAAVGAVAGAAAGTGAAAATGKLNVEVPAETVVRFSLKEPLQIQM